VYRRPAVATVTDLNAHPARRRRLLLERHPDLAYVQRLYEEITATASATRRRCFEAELARGASITDIAEATGLPVGDVARAIGT
jgi:hypothetical protein